MPYAASGVLDISRSTRDNVQMGMKNGLARALTQKAILWKAWARLLAASRMSTVRSFPRPTGFMFFNQLLHIDDQLPILGKPLLPRGEMVGTTAWQDHSAARSSHTHRPWSPCHPSSTGASCCLSFNIRLSMEEHLQD